MAPVSVAVPAPSLVSEPVPLIACESVNAFERLICSVALLITALVGIVVAFRRYLARQPHPFAATLDEIGNDRACIRNPS